LKLGDLLWQATSSMTEWSTWQATLTLLSLLQGGRNADIQRAEPVAGLGFILLQWCYHPATIPLPDYDCFLSGLLSAIGVQLIGWSRSVVWL